MKERNAPDNGPAPSWHAKQERTVSAFARLAALIEEFIDTTPWSPLHERAAAVLAPQEEEGA